MFEEITSIAEQFQISRHHSKAIDSVSSVYQTDWVDTAYGCAKMTTNNFTGGVEQKFVQLLCTEPLTGGLHYQLTCLSVVNIFLSVTAFVGNTLILVALHRESSLHPPSKLLFRCLAVTDLCVGLISEPLSIAFWMSAVNKRWDICRYTLSSVVVGYILLSVSLLTLTAISVDRLLALLLGMRYRQVVTLKRTYALVAVFWVVSSTGITLFYLDHRITYWGGYISITLCLVTSIASYTKIFLTLRRHKTQVQNHDQRQPTQVRIPSNLARYRKAVYSSLWLQLTLAVCYLPYGVMVAISTNSLNKLSPSVFLARQCAVTLVFLNSSLNPILYCWKIREVRQAVKDTIRQFSCSSS